MKKNLFKVLFSSALAIPALTLASCSASFSHFGTYSSVSSNYNSLVATNPKEGMEKTFNGYSYDSIHMPTSSNLKDGNEYSQIGWVGILLPTLFYVNSIMNLSFYNESISLQNSIFETNDLKLLTEFNYALKNVLNSGRQGQIKFGITNVDLNFSVINPGEDAENKPKSLYANKGETLKIETKTDENNKMGHYFPNLQFGIKLTFGYWYANDNNLEKNKITSIEPVVNYVKANKSWPNGVLPTTVNFELEMKYLMSIKTTYPALVESYKKDFGEQKPEQKPDSTPEEDKDKPTHTSVTFDAADFDKVKPVLSIHEYKKIGNETSLPNLSSEEIRKDMEQIGKIISEYGANKEEVNKMQNRYKNFFALSLPNK